jgi:dynein light intermediate chain
MTIQAYQTLFESSIAFGMRKSLQAEQRTAEMHIKIEKLEEENAKLDAEIEHLSDEIMELLQKEKDAKADGEAIHQQQVDDIMSENRVKLDALKNFLTKLH